MLIYVFYQDCMQMFLISRHLSFIVSFKINKLYERLSGRVCVWTWEFLKGVRGFGEWTEHHTVSKAFIVIFNSMNYFLKLSLNKDFIIMIFQGQKQYKKLKEATLLFQCCTRRWKAQKVLAELKHEKKMAWAVGIIYKYFLGWKVRRDYKPKFRKIAGPKIARFFVVALVSSKTNYSCLFVFLFEI